MRPEEQKRSVNYGILCGLRADNDSESSRTTTPEPAFKDDKFNGTSAKYEAHKRPQSLTLPFENRDRESHLVSDEEFDRIVQQAELQNVLPALPATALRDKSISGLRRSISTARNNPTSNLMSKQRPLSAELSTLSARLGAFDRDQPVSISRDPTLTALPRALTENELAGNSKYTTRHQVSQLRSKRKADNRRSIAIDVSQNVEVEDNIFTGLFQNGHKRSVSTAGMVESVKKRIKRNVSSPIVGAQHYGPSPSKFSIGSPRRQLDGFINPLQQHPIDTEESQGFKDTTMTDVGASFHPSTHLSPDSVRKSILQRTWSRTRHHATKFSVSYSSSSNNSRPSISEPVTLALATMAPPVRTPTPQSYRTNNTDSSVRTATSTGTSRYDASAEPSPRSTKPGLEFISGPPLKKHPLTRLGMPPRRTELNTVVARQQSRIVDLTLQNNVLVSQIDSLRNEVVGLRLESSHEDSGHEGDTERTPHRRCRIQAEESDVYGGGNRAQNISRNSAGTAWSSSVSARRRISSGKIQQDPAGWRHIMGVYRNRGEGDSGIDADGDEHKRDTWMTCDS